MHLRSKGYLSTLYYSFAVMSGCWCEDPKERPHFNELCFLMDQHLSLVSDYTELKMILVEEPGVHGMGRQLLYNIMPVARVMAGST